MATSFWNFKAPKSHDEEMEMRQAAAAGFLQSEAIERARQRMKEQEERDHEAWKRQLLRDRKVTIHASTSSAPSHDITTAAVTTYAIASGGGSGRSEPMCLDLNPSDTSSTSSDSSNSGGSND